MSDIKHDSNGRLVSPCMGCEKRKVGCHSTCFAYIFYRAKLKRLKCERRDYWYKQGYEPAEKERRRRLKAMWLKKSKH